MSKKTLFIDLEKLDEIIEKLEHIKKTMEIIKNLKESIGDIPFNDQPVYPIQPQPTPMPYFPQQPATTDPPWAPPYKIWCKADTDGDIII